MSTSNQNNKEEVDLGSLFVIIGKGFKNFFNFIGSIFKGTFHFLISILLFFKKHFIKFLIAALLGFIGGVYLEYSKEKIYRSDLLVQPNFSSTKQLYNNINYYNNLVKQENFNLLASIFKIDTIKASSLKKFEISPFIRKIDVINSFNRFVTTSDSLTVDSFNFHDFNDSFSDVVKLVVNYFCLASLRGHHVYFLLSKALLPRKNSHIVVGNITDMFVR